MVARIYTKPQTTNFGIFYTKVALENITIAAEFKSMTQKAVKEGESNADYR